MTAKIYNDRNQNGNYLQEGVILTGKGVQGTLSRQCILHIYLDVFPVTNHRICLMNLGFVQCSFVFFVYIFLPLLLGKVEAEFLSVACAGRVECIVNFGRSTKNPTQPLSCSRIGDKRCLTLPFISPVSINVMI